MNDFNEMKNRLVDAYAQYSTEKKIAFLIATSCYLCTNARLKLRDISRGREVGIQLNETQGKIMGRLFNLYLNLEESYSANDFFDALFETVGTGEFQDEFLDSCIQAFEYLKAAKNPNQG